MDLYTSLTFYDIISQQLLFYLLLHLGNGNPLQYSCLENPMVGGALVGYSSWGHKESDTTE